MIILGVVSSLKDFELLGDNSFKAAREIGYKTIVVRPKNLMIPNDSEYEEIEISDFAAFGEANVAKACKEIEDNSLVLHVDPDEFYSKKLLSDIFAYSSTMNPGDIGFLSIQYLFKHKKLYGTPWGRVQFFPKLAYKESFEIRVNVHQRLKGIERKVSSSEVILHYWADTFEEIESKHARYLMHEGKLKAELYGRWKFSESLLRLIRVHFGILRRIHIKDGFNGLRLSLIFSNYARLAEKEFKHYSLFISKRAHDK